ncbi:nose resistant to fluoxetine protein 6-like [Schistocerca piceifrons]|uniref:nose resistant to fluoxetine protein 6-like n=1 Tax=Schistocerca piceifrons TaxID=274613 RepID=UPI001F5EB0DF|nr:nose resistant to fluoxetine protein 6-like [Schistocerca piceifrons]
MAATAPSSTWPRLCLLLLLLQAAASAQQADSAGFREAAGLQRSLPIEDLSADVRGPEESTDWEGGAGGTLETTTEDAEDAESLHVMKVPAAAAAHGGSVHRHEDIPPELAASAGLPDVVRLVALAAARLEAGTACGDHSTAFLQALRNFTLWAVQMYDASVKAPSGVLYGSVYQLGHFDQCVTAGAGGLRGQYCLPQVQALPAEPQPLPADPYSDTFQQDQSAWLKLQFAGDQMKIRRDKGWWAVCVPASCSPRQVQRALDAAFRVAGPRMRMQLRAELRDDHCSTGEPLQPGRSTVIFVCLIAALLVLAAIGSYYDARLNNKDVFKPEKRKGLGRQIMECFSVQQNYRRLTITNKSNMDLDVFGFMRTFSLLCIIAGHRLLHYYGSPIYNGEDEDKLFRQPAGMLVANGVLLVDVFFTIGAMTMTSLLFQGLHKGAKFHQLFLEIINRYVRLTPLYVLVILFHCGVLPYMGSGPFWKSTVLQEQTRCETNWWTNVLYVNNYIDPGNMCVFQSWYMSADFHFFIVSLFLGYMTWRWPVAGWAAMGCVTIISMVLPFMTIYLQNLDALVMPFPHVLKNFRENKVFQKLYVPSHNRATPYLLGVMAGILVYRGRNLKRKMNEVSSFVVFVTYWCVGVALLFSAYVFFIPGRPYNALEAAIYGALNRPAMALLICIYGSFPVISNSKIILNFLSAKIFVILGRLSFAAYLIHTIPQIYDQGSLRQPRHIDAYSGVWLVIADYCITYPAAAVLYVLVEAPFRGVMKVLLQRTK